MEDEPPAWPEMGTVERPENWLLVDLDRCEPMKHNGRTCGWFKPGEYTPGINNVYLRSVDADHYCQRYAGWGIQAGIVEILKARGCEWVCLKVATESGPREKWVAFERFENGIYDILNSADGLQAFVPEFLFTDKPME